MIRINLLRGERRKRGFYISDFRKIAQFNLRDINVDKLIFIIPVAGAVLVVGQIVYLFNINSEVNRLRGVVAKLTVERNNIRAKANKIEAERNRLQKEIDALRREIENIDMSKDIIMALKDYYRPFTDSVGYFYKRLPSTAWLTSFSQRMDFEKVNLNISFGSYSVEVIKSLYSELKDEFPHILIGQIEKKESSKGIFYYVSSMEIEKTLEGRLE